MPLTPEQAAELGLPPAPASRALTSLQAQELGLPAVPVRTGAGESFVRGGLQGATFGWGDEAAAAIDAALPSFLRNQTSDEAVGQGETYGERYASARDYYRNRNAAAQQSNPKTYLGGELAGGTATLLAVPGAGAARAPTLLGRLAPAAKAGATVGGITGAGMSESDSPAGVVGDAASGAVTGAVLGPVGEAGMTAAGNVGRRVLGRLVAPSKAAPAQETITLTAPEPNAARKAIEARITPTKDAEFLRAQGVPLTVGQMNPRSAIGQIEEASTSLRYTGPAIAAQRDAAKQGWQQVILGKALPPGMKGVPKADTLPEQLDKIYVGFEPAYAAVKGEIVYPAIHMGGKGMPLQTLGKSVGAFDQAVADPSVLADDATRAVAKRFLDNELTRLPQRKGAVGQVPVENLLVMRSNIRTAWRQAKRSGKYDLADLLDNAENAVTQAVESQVKPGTAAMLQKTDAQYRVYKIVEDAVARANDSPSGFTPTMLTQSLKSSMDKGAFARGGGGELRDLSSAGRNVFESVSPPTGARLLTVGPLAEWLTGPATFMINRPAASRVAAPNLPALPGAQLTPEVAALLSILNRERPAVRLAPAGADEERPK